MEKVKVYYDQTGNTLTVWLSDPAQEYVCEETGNEVVLMKNKAGKVIGFEKLNYSFDHTANLAVSFETVTG